jgi:hypothetical protein
MITLYAFREWQSSYSQTTILKDSEGKVKAIFNSSIRQPKFKQKTVIVNHCTFALNWDNVSSKYIKLKDRN